MHTAVTDFYRCPKAFVNYEMADDPSPNKGFFRFGGDTLYGQSCSGIPANEIGEEVQDLSRNVNIRGKTVQLPFDPNQIIEELRRERYVHQPEFFFCKARRKLYYFLRPLLLLPIRKRIQRAYHRGWKDVPFPSWPVDTTVEGVRETLLRLCMKAQGLERVPFIWFWPEGAPGCAIVTHDVEASVGFDLVPDLMRVDDGAGIKASFQLVPERRYAVSSGVRDAIHGSGFEVNVHDLNHEDNLFSDREQFLLCARSINWYVREWGAQGFRAGRMYRNPDWYGALNISYDMSVPNVAHLDPQRGGCCTVFPYFIGRILELPLTTIQDYSLFHIVGSYTPDLWEDQIARILKRCGMVSILAHPDYVMRERELAVYKTLLGRLAEQRRKTGLWIALPREVDRWWRERSQMKLVCEGGSWRIQGTGSERARLAYANLVGDRIEYSLDIALDPANPAVPIPARQICYVPQGRSH
jgi:hypothetical protein